MKQLNKFETFLFILGGILMVAGVGLYVFDVAPQVVSLAFLVGAILFAIIQMLQGYQGTSTAIRRLRKIMVIGDVAFIIAGLLMFENGWRLIYQSILENPDNIDALKNYLAYINNKWVVALLIAAVLELYSMNRISYELKKEERKTEKSIKE